MAKQLPKHNGSREPLHDHNLSVAHFLPLTDHERRTWNDDAAVNPRNFSASVSPPRPRSLQSAQAILDALDTLDAFFLPSAYGSPTASQYFSCAKRFCTTLNRRFPITPLSVPVVVAWLDDQFHSFGSAIATDFQYARRPSVYTQSFTTFDINRPASYQLQMCITQAYLVSQPTRTVHHNPTRHSTTTVQSDSIGQHSTAQHSRVGIPPAVRDNIPTSDGKSICLRFLSNKGCNAGPLGALCGRGSRARIHAIPTRLPSSVSSHIVTHLNGLKQEYSHLA
ncbi:hypothetical protein H257_12267 [Aphanomyces astaci]|uniref:Uncharacterized protein n=1 Tax=Aphanomyces astaci TaxID=112090 RepID=W4FZN2_APHAT|nr:hypothetical protein H257_12267 [Aphanomyces astaci]ETV72937.1 hypothetical protein H257_12267 [Aphanomyces astaci]|eukprot:XP_009837723.1 hypothetical protein H257_12267 [Aphanomyces astaci]